MRQGRGGLRRGCGCRRGKGRALWPGTGTRPNQARRLSPVPVPGIQSYPASGTAAPRSNDQASSPARAPQPLVAVVDEARCTGCGTCATVCPFGAISLNPKASVDPHVCRGCGQCQRACPNNAIVLTRRS